MSSSSSWGHENHNGNLQYCSVMRKHLCLGKRVFYHVGLLTNQKTTTCCQKQGFSSKTPSEEMKMWFTVHRDYIWWVAPHIYLICKSCESFSTETAIVDLFIQRTYFLVSKAKIKKGHQVGNRFNTVIYNFSDNSFHIFITLYKHCYVFNVSKCTNSFSFSSSRSSNEGKKKKI